MPKKDGSPQANAANRKQHSKAGPQPAVCANRHIGHPKGRQANQSAHADRAFDAAGPQAFASARSRAPARSRAARSARTRSRSIAATCSSSAALRTATGSRPLASPVVEAKDACVGSSHGADQDEQREEVARELVAKAAPAAHAPTQAEPPIAQRREAPADTARQSIARKSSRQGGSSTA